MKKFMKKNNKGFSLVELIVVVLIIAIIAVALAPQVTKWVQKAKDNTEKSNIATLNQAVQAVVTDCMSENETLPENTFTVAYASNALVITYSSETVTDFDTKLKVALANFKDASNTYEVTIDSNGSVKVEIQ